MRKYTVITKYGSKWLRPVNPFDPRDIMWQEFNYKEPDLPYLGYRPEGTVLYESEVSEVKQGLCEYTMKWITEYDDDLPMYSRYRTAYVDDPDRDVDYEKEMPRKQWPSTKYIARKVSSEPCVDPLAPYQVTVTVQIDQFDNVTLTCPAGHTFSAKSEGLADFFHKSHFE